VYKEVLLLAGCQRRGLLYSISCDRECAYTL
jgi:hypothetical protein